MAKATRAKIDPPPPPLTIRLDLTEDEATTLVSILRSVGGPETSRRRYASRILGALEDVHVARVSEDDMEPGRSSIYFKNVSDPFDF